MPLRPFERIGSFLPRTMVWWCLVVLMHQTPKSSRIKPIADMSFDHYELTPQHPPLSPPPYVPLGHCLVVFGAAADLIPPLFLCFRTCVRRSGGTPRLPPSPPSECPRHRTRSGGAVHPRPAPRGRWLTASWRRSTSSTIESYAAIHPRPLEPRIAGWLAGVAYPRST
ncbi:hypothetical protein CYMTET_10907 [Cymbomonas tetramitiformis]|uniref:Uncharacterized protein n=1 Tax=Cymbomonas tetramitiformis TaxID=36881 RepID=A0AAE0LDC9_9CHLO|nr:hypothetical protein CYMTET_10907 [Cymbomonas tetramitiformis]